MISPIAVCEYSKAEDSLRRGYARLSRVVRPEIVELTAKGNTIFIGFAFLERGKSPQIRAVYGDGPSEPEVYTDRSDWYNFDASDYINYFDKPEDILMRVIRSELRKALQAFLKVPGIPDALLEFCLEKNERSTLEIPCRSKLCIHLTIDDFQISYDIGPGNKVAMKIMNMNNVEMPQFIKALSLTELSDVEVFAKHQIGSMMDAVHLTDEVIQRVLVAYAPVKLSEKFPSAECLGVRSSFKSELAGSDLS
ncbi:unnamed protein product [Hydatigera taeniaeformis]|uniref:DUF4304 domain-containing protein n=1 Tax=Hydatigena taeniaeformis TaxID=6205 RepID=A0A0R3WTJ6_HYDTA|nr:unnamed protein product [Hydatigera taeniaeformis]